MDLVFDNFVMERRLLASAMYGLAMFGVLNVLLPLVAGVDHLTGLIVAAAATPAVGRAAVVLGAPGAVAAGRAAHRRDDRRRCSARVWYGRAFDPAGAARDARDRGRPRHDRQLRVPARLASTRSAPTSSTACAAARCCASRAGSRRTSSTCGRSRGQELARVTPERMRVRRRRRRRVPQHFPHEQAAGRSDRHVVVHDATRSAASSSACASSRSSRRTASRSRIRWSRATPGSTPRCPTRASTSPRATARPRRPSCRRALKGGRSRSHIVRVPGS